MKKKIILKKIFFALLDLIIAGVILCVFALFHHVIPQKGNTDNAILIPRPTASQAGFQIPSGIPSFKSTNQAERTPSISAPPVVNTPCHSVQTAMPSVQTAAPTAQTETPSVPTIAPSVQTTAPNTIIQTETMYRSSNILVNMKTVETNSGRSKITYHVADIYVTDIEFFKTAFAEDTYGENYTEDVLDQDVANNAIVAISGDSYGLTDTGIVLRNGVLYKYENTDNDICVLYYDGTMETLSPGEYSKQSLIEKGAYQVWNFGPGLLDENGNAKTSFNAGKYITKAHPRASIGYYAPGHYVFVLVDGRQDDYSEGMTLKELAELYEELGCKAAYNLDGGISAVMTFNDNIYSHPEKTREVSDIIYIAEQ